MSRKKTQPTPHEDSDGSSRSRPSPKGKKARGRKAEDDSEEELSNTLAFTTLSLPEDNDLPSIFRPLTPPSPSMPPSILVTSIGNPGSKYLNTLHSAGHYVLLHLAHWRKYDPWRPFAGGEAANVKDKRYTPMSLLKGYADALDEPTLWRSGAMMNVSGPAVKKAWMKWKQDNDAEGQGKLIIVHDELERELGSVTLKADWKLSAKGHNGIKSIKAAMPNTPFIRIGIGIGRPESRDPNAVANHVLRQMTAREKQIMTESAGRVWQLIKEVEEEMG